MSKNKIYLAGPMRGKPGLNVSLFRKVTEKLEQQGYSVFNPAIDAEEDKTIAQFMEMDLPEVCRSNLMVVLPGWEKSTGARIEVSVAQHCSIPVVIWPDLGPIRHPNSERFHQLVEEVSLLHDRKQQDYGKGDDPFANVRASEDWGIPGWVGSMIRLNDKVKRLQNFAAKGSLQNESVVDSLLDISVYALIALVLYEEAGIHQQQENSLEAVKLERNSQQEK